MTEGKPPEPDDKEQSARFKETAERILSEDAETKFEQALKRILPTKRSAQTQAEDAQTLSDVK